MKYKRVWIKFTNDQEITILIPASQSLSEGFTNQSFTDSDGKLMWINPDRVIRMKELAYVERYW